MTEAELHAECKRRFQKSRPMSDAQWADWLADVTAHGGVLVLTIGDGAYASYPREDAPQTPPRVSNHHSRPEPQETT